MSELALRPLTYAHGPRMHAINRACPIEADFSFFFDRAPDFFRWPESVFDTYVYVGGFRDERLVAYALFATVGGRVPSLADRYSYVGDMRVVPEERGGAFPERATRALLEVVPAEAVAFALVKLGNEAARASLAKTRLPNMGVARLCSYDAANVLFLRRSGGARRFRVRRATEADLPALADLMQRAYEGRLFGPIVTPDELARDVARLPGFDVSSYWLAFAGTELVGALGAWDADSVRRVTVLRLSPRAKFVGAVYAAARKVFRSVAPLPAPGESFRMLTTTRIAVPSGEPEVLRDLVAAVHDAHFGRGYHMLTVGFTGDDPLAPALRGLLVQHFRSDIVVIAPPPNLDIVLRERRPYIDPRFV